jgi:hypothetical protein
MGRVIGEGPTGNGGPNCGGLKLGGPWNVGLAGLHPRLPALQDLAT